MIAEQCCAVHPDPLHLDTTPPPSTPLDHTLHRDSSWTACTAPAAQGAAFFADMDDERLKQFAELSYLQPVKPNDPIFAEGEAPPSFFVVADGEVQASVSDGIGSTRPPVAEWVMAPGQYFGEVGLMLPDAPQLSTYKAGPERCAPHIRLRTPPCRRHAAATPPPRRRHQPARRCVFCPRAKSVPPRRHAPPGVN